MRSPRLGGGEVTYTEQDWRETLSKPGGVAVCMSPSWLTNGCPVCGCTEWTVTSDHWAYCDDCSKGIPTAYPFTHATLWRLGKNGYSCPICNGTGVDDGEPCDLCDGGRLS